MTDIDGPRKWSLAVGGIARELRHGALVHVRTGAQPHRSDSQSPPAVPSRHSGAQRPLYMRVALDVVINTSDFLATAVRAIEVLRAGMRACLPELRDTVTVWSAERRNHTERD